MPDDDATPEASYDADGVDQLETIWGEGFLSPGGGAEVGRIVAGVELAGADVLDIGCGTGGAACVLAAEHDAGSVTGADIEAFVIERATARARSLGYDDRVRFTVVEPGPLPFPDASFDVVFSKDAIIHVRDKAALYAEALRVLRPGGRLCIGDWLRGSGADLDASVERFIDVTGEEFFMQSLDDLADLVSSSGFVGVETEDRGDWYAAEAQRELDRIRGPLREQFRRRFDEAFYDATVRFWETAVEATRSGALRPGHLRAGKPVTAP